MIFLLCLLYSCGGSSDKEEDHSLTQSAQILYIKDPLLKCQSRLLVETQQLRYQRNVKTTIDNNQMHLVYFSPADNGDYQINYLQYDMSLFENNSNMNSSVIQVDHSRDLQIKLTTDQIPLVMYQGGSYPTCGETEQSDIMLSLFQNDQWQEYTISLGTVERNPVINNGLAGYSSDMIVDSTNTIHMCFQFLYEGCDSMNYNYPDLWYVQITPDNLDELPEHEVVEGNNYENANIQNNAGAHCSIALDNNNTPFIFYYFVDTHPIGNHGLRVSYRNDQDNWETQWIDTDIHVDAISASWNEHQGKMAVAYYVTQNSYASRDYVLMYAEQTINGWQSSVVDKSCYCGNYCSLTFDNNGDPIIAYQADKTRSNIVLNQLKIASRKSDVWNSYFCVAIIDDPITLNTLGIDNSIHVDDHSFYITSYSDETHGIYLLFGDLEYLE